jgi:ATP-dependent helicase HrpA
MHILTHLPSSFELSEPRVTTAPFAPPLVSPALHLAFPPDLPVSARREEIMQAMREHQVVVVCGETGSGKTTQLPKMALALGRGKANGGGLIGHTQPRRVAATSVAKRIAQEMKSEPGDVVGYKIRFQDRLGAGASIKLMTDGILLAETQRDPLLKAYDTLIIDEAHERSLNIDFLLGYLRQLLPRRPDLKVVITSATIDAERFAQYFAGRRGPAPVIMVSGRTFEVEVRWRPFEESRDHDLNDAVADAVDELWRGGGKSGDILVFMPGEREIREATQHLQKHLSHQPALRDTEVLPLFARLSQAEQDRIFKEHHQRRIVLATNVAETSLTVPGIRYVIDTGVARVKRYSYRQKVEQLQIEAISQAAANQRSGRCGRVAQGIAIRLYDEAGFANRPRFTDPEILRSSLAGVILRMKHLGLGAVQDFAFIEPPKQRAITDGYQLLSELGAIDDDLELTPVGQTLSRWPLDPRVGRMLLAANERGALAEALVIASALSVQDVRDRPLDKQAQADQAQKPFDDDKSEFLGTLRLWNWLHTARGGHAANAGGDAHKLSNRQYEQLLREHYINVRRVREWRDVHTQLHTVVAEHGWRLNDKPATYEQLHTSLLTGLLGNIGCKNDTEDWYLGARGIKFWRHPGAHLNKKPGRWLVAAELVETTRLFGRGLASIEPQWLEQVGGHLLKTQTLDPRWEKKAGQVVAYERATLYGLVVYSQRRIDYSKVDLPKAREIFIREALAAEEIDTRLPFMSANKRMVREVLELEHKSRRQDVMVDDALIEAFYDAQLPANVCDQRSLEAWWKNASRDNPQCLRLSREDLMRHAAEGVTAQRFPAQVRLGGVDCAAAYLHEPGDPKDGVTVTVPLFVLNQVSPEVCEWLVPGLLAEKIHALLKSLHQKPRARLVPLPQTAEQFAQALSAPECFGRGGLLQALLPLIQDKTQLALKVSDFKSDMVGAHLHMNLRVVDEHGRQLGMGRSLAALKADLGGQARGAFQALASIKLEGLRSGQAEAVAIDPSPTLPSGASRRQASSHPGHKPKPTGKSQAKPVADAAQRHLTWDFGALPELMEIRKGGQTLIGFPALIDQGDAVVIEVFDEPEVAATKHRAGLARLFALNLKDAIKYLEKNIPDLQKMAVAYMPLGTQEELRAQIIDVALDRAFLLAPLPSDAASFEARMQEGRGRLNLIAQEIARLAATILTEYASAQRKIKDTKSAPEATTDCTQQLQRLMPKRFIALTPWPQLQHFARYLKAIVMRLDKVRGDPARDALRLKELAPMDQRYWRLLAERKGQTDEPMLSYRWLLEELRVSLFAQELRTPQPVSIKRLDKAWAGLNR